MLNYNSIHVVHKSTCVNDILIVIFTEYLGVTQCSMYSKEINKPITILVVTLLIRIISAAVYYVIPDDSSQYANRSFTLQHYIDNSQEYFRSHTQLYFSPGKYYLQDDLVVQNVTKFTISGNRSVLICNNSSLGIIINNVKSIMITNIELKHCGKVYDVHTDLNKHRIDKQFSWRGAIFINHSTAVVIHNVSVMVSAGVSGMIVINSKSKFTIVNYSVLVTCEQFNLTSGMLFYNDDCSATSVTYAATNISHKTIGLCNNSIALVLLMVQEEYGITFNVYNTSFSHLHNSNVMYYYGKSCGNNNNKNVVTFKNCQVKYNSGNSHLNMFYISIHSEDYTFLHVREKDTKQCNRRNIINFRNCDFVNNLNMNSLIYVNLKNCLGLNTIVDIRNSYILNNSNVAFFMSNCQAKTFWQVSLIVNMMFTYISFNRHNGSASLISLKNAVMKLMEIVIIKKNQYKKTAIIQLHFSILKFLSQSNISENRARYILQSNEGSYYLLEEGATVNIINNIVYSVFHNALSFDNNLQEICWFQFVSKEGNLDKDVREGIKLDFKIWLKNKYIIPKIPTHQSTFLTSRNCSWLSDTAFQTTSSHIVYQKVITSSGRRAGSKQMKKVPSRLCHCLNTTSYDCTERELGEIFPGQTLKTHLLMDPSIPSKSTNATINVKNDRLPRNSCAIKNGLEMLQTGSSHSCIQYNYTVWHIGKYTKCELYLSTEDMLEVFYITIRPCPIGFSLHSTRRTCDCDTILNMHDLSITSCNLDDETILRPANSWLSGSTVNGSHTYRVTLSCPFDYCLPHPSHLNFSDPDTQCQFSRSGELCGKCKKGLSTVFGSSRCKKCSNMFLFIIIPIAIAGFVLVAMLFIFNLTVTNGKINTIIFYANIININHLIFFPKHNSPLYIFLSLLNLDLGIETCFYDGMDDYVKSWLQLLFPIYLLVIASLIIITSRYSVRIQRITARKVLPVLATLFLLSYTKILRTIGSVLFWYSEVTRLPSKNTTLVWSVCTSIPLFGVRFVVLFIVCSVFFLIVLPFNGILLFSRKLTYFKFINRLKPLLDAYHGPYKDKVPYWVGLQLVIRKIVFGLSAFNKDVNFLAASILFGILFCIHGVVNPFNSKFLNIKEALILLNLLAIHITAFYNSSDGTDSLEIIKYLILTAAIYFVIIFLYQCLMMVINKKIFVSLKSLLNQKKWKLCKKQSSNNQEPHKATELRMAVPNVTYDYKDFQEPLLALST